MTNGGNSWQLPSACGGPFPECHNSYPAGGYLLPLEARSTLPMTLGDKEKKKSLLRISGKEGLEYQSKE